MSYFVVPQPVGGQWITLNERFPLPHRQDVSVGGDDLLTRLPTVLPERQSCA
jgi:hypothetical protein